MSDLSVQAIKTLNKNELKLELKNRGLDGQGKKEDLVNRLAKAIIEIPSNPDKQEYLFVLVLVSLTISSVR